MKYYSLKHIQTNENCAQFNSIIIFFIMSYCYRRGKVGKPVKVRLFLNTWKYGKFVENFNLIFTITFGNVSNRLKEIGYINYASFLFWTETSSGLIVNKSENFIISTFRLRKSTESIFLLRQKFRKWISFKKVRR